MSWSKEVARLAAVHRVLRSLPLQRSATALRTCSKGSWPAAPLRVAPVLHLRRKNSKVSPACLDICRPQVRRVSTRRQLPLTTLSLTAVSLKDLASMGTVLRRHSQPLLLAQVSRVLGVAVLTVSRRLSKVRPIRTQAHLV